MIAFMRRDDKHKRCDHDWELIYDPDMPIGYMGREARCKHCGIISPIL